MILIGIFLLTHNFKSLFENKEESVQLTYFFFFFFVLQN